MKKKTTLLLILSILVLPLRAQELADLFEKNKKSVVTIFVNESANTGSGDSRTFAASMGLGSGVLIREDVVLTAAHVVADADQIMVQFFDGETLEAATSSVSRMADVALINLKQTPSDPQVAPVGNSDQARIGEDIFIVGAPLGLPYSLSSGIISGKHIETNLSSDGNSLEFFQTDASINTGNSGGPMFNYNGEVIGIVSSILTRSGGFEGIGFAVTSNVARSLLMQQDSRFFGIEARVLSREMARILNVPQESGWLVQHVAPDSPAALAGLKGADSRIIAEEEEILVGGDIILQVDGILIKGEQSIPEVWESLNGDESTRTHEISILRSGEILDLRWVAPDTQTTRQ